MKNIYFQIVILFFIAKNALAQGAVYPMSNERAYWWADRNSILAGKKADLHTSQKVFTRGELVYLALCLDTTRLSRLDRADRQYIFDDNNEWLQQPVLAKSLTERRRASDSAAQLLTDALNAPPPQYTRSKRPLFRHFYKTPADLFALNTRSFGLKVNPILYLGMGQEQQEKTRLFYNLRGAEIRGHIDERVYFHSQIFETQAQFPNYIRQIIDSNGYVPHNGFFKRYSSATYGVTNGYDFLNAQGVIGINFTPHIGLQMGHGRHFIGNGYRSLILSDFSNNYFYARLNTQVWKFKYQNIFAEIQADNRNLRRNDGLLPKKYFALHHLSINITPQLNIGIFEATVFKRNNNFELQYLNPVILYRSVEQALGSPDNVILGFDGKWNLFKRVSLYGQFVLDEFYFRELFLNKRQWWANKYSVQVGAKYINAFGIDHLDLQAEYNRVRPYTYSHYDSSANYTHNLQPLAHPLGANFEEFLFIARYQPHKNWFLSARFMSARVGEDTPTENWGNNPNLPNNNRVREYGNVMFQGADARIQSMVFEASYAFWHNMYLDVSVFKRQKNSSDVARSLQTFYINMALRMNVNAWRELL